MDMTPLPDALVTNGKAPPATGKARVRPTKLARSAAALGTCALLAACGSVAAPTSGGAGSNSSGSASAGSTATGSTPAGANSAATSSAAAAATAKVSIDVTFAAFGGSLARHYALTCDPAGGTTPDPAVACAKLLTGVDIFAPLPRSMACPMVLQGARATVTGTYFGRDVHVVIVNGGCDLVRWAKLKSIFG